MTGRGTPVFTKKETIQVVTSFHVIIPSLFFKIFSSFNRAAWEEAWVQQGKITNITPLPDPLAAAKALVNQYKDQ